MKNMSINIAIPYKIFDHILNYDSLTAVPYAKISEAPCMIKDVENLRLITASAFNLFASAIILSNACSRASACNFVYSSISPPTTFLNAAKISLPKFLALTVLPLAIPKTSVISFNLANIHHYDIGSIIDNEGIAVRTGHHCAQPIMDYYKIPGTIRLSLSFYNTKEEIDSLISAIIVAKKMLS